MTLTQITTGGVDENINIDNNTLKVDGTNNRVGIGTAAPGLPLDVVSNSSSETVRFRGASSGNVGTLRFTSNDGSTNYSFIQSRSTFFDLGTDESIPLTFSTDGSERLRIDSSGNVGIGTTSPSAQIHLNQSGTGSYSTLRLSNSGASGRTYEIGVGGSTSGTGYAGNLYFYDSTASAIRAVIDSSGNVGIGTTIPGSFNSDGRNLVVGTGSGGQGMSIYSGNSSYGTIYFADGTSGDALYQGAVLYNHSSNFMRLDTAGAERMRIDSSGRLLIGTSTEGNAAADNLTIADSAACGITIRSGTSSNGAIYFSDATSGSGEFDGYIIYEQGNRKLRFATAQTERMVITSDGKIHLGDRSGSNATAFGGAQVNISKQDDIATSFSKTASYLQLGAGETTPNGLYPISFGFSPNNATHVPAYMGFKTTNSSSFENGALVFATRDVVTDTAPSERMRINSSGWVLVGTTSEANTTSGVKFNQSGQAFFVASNNPALQCNRLGGDGTVVSIRNDSTQVGTISVSGSTTAYNETSDYRLKENVVDITDGITRVKQLQPKRFNFIVDADTTVDGFLAHEAQTVVPEAVTGTHNEVDDDGNPVMQQIDKSKLVPLLTAALQEAIAKIETLEIKVAALEAAE